LILKHNGRKRNTVKQKGSKRKRKEAMDCEMRGRKRHAVKQKGSKKEGKRKFRVDE
jgi:hypothetical protein